MFTVASAERSGTWRQQCAHRYAKRDLDMAVQSIFFGAVAQRTTLYFHRRVIMHESVASKFVRDFLPVMRACRLEIRWIARR